MIQNNYRLKTIRGVVSSVGPLQVQNDSSYRRMLTIKTGTDRDTRYIGAYLVGDIANDCIIHLGEIIEVTYKTVANGERVIIGGI